MPAQVGDLESFAGHGLDGIAEDRLYVSDFYDHARSQSPQQGDSINVNKVNQIESIHQRNENNRTERLGLLCPVVSILVIFMMKVFWRHKIVRGLNGQESQAGQILR